jgi:uncharacterized paraquat-inducible protein A
MASCKCPKCNHLIPIPTSAIKQSRSKIHCPHCKTEVTVKVDKPLSTDKIACELRNSLRNALKGNKNIKFK